jgi:hypothetical protein
MANTLCEANVCASRQIENAGNIERDPETPLH